MFVGQYKLILTLILVSAVYGKTKGGWASWSEWSSWGKGLCSGNQRVKTRACTNPLPDTNGDYCDGDNAKQESGSVDGGLSEWSQWSTCEVPCGGSVVNRTRLCDNPPPSNGGSFCTGSLVETKLECVMECPEGRTDGGWSPWSPWSACPKTCTKNGGAIIKRYRQCNMPPPMFGGKACPGNFTETIFGCFNVCPVHGGFSGWSSFTECSKTCGSGTMRRKRMCNNPVPSGENARNCSGAFTETKHCKLANCIGAIDGNWAGWSSWSPCSENRFCFKGHTKRSRACTNPAPNKGGDSCNGAVEEVKVCPTKSCKDDKPTPSPTLPVSPGDYIHRECGGVNLKYIGSSAPADVLKHLNFRLKKFTSGYFGTLEEEGGSVKKYCFEPFPPLTIKEAADKVPSYRKTDPIPEYSKPTDENLPILGFSVRVTNDQTTSLKGWDFGINEAYEYVPKNKVRLHQVMFTYYSDGTHYGFLAKGQFRLFSPTIFKSVVFRNISFLDDVSSMVGTAQKMQLRGLVNAIGLPDDLDGAAGAVIAAIKNLGLWDFEFGPVSIAYDFKHLFKSPFRISATKSFNGVPLHFEVIYIHAGWDRKIAFGFTFDGESFGAVLDKMANTGSVGKAVSNFLNAIGLQVEMAIAWCPSFYGSFRTTKTTRFSKEPLKDLYKMEIPEGLTAVAAVSIPKDCDGSSFCEVLKSVVGPKARFRIAGQVKKGYYKVSAGFYKIKITGNYYFHKLELFAEVNTTANKRVVGFKAEVKIPVNVGEIIVDGMKSERSLVLGGSLKHTIGTSDLTGTLYMKGGIWYHAFGLNWLNIGNIHLAITITVGSPIGLSGFQFGAQLDFGKNCIYDADFAEEGHCLRVAIYFGYGKPTYFYGRISALTIGKLVRMCGGPTSLPGPVHRAGFPKGLRVSYNPSGKDVDLRSAGGPLIQNGFRLKGVLDLFGYQIKAEIKYSAREIYIDGELDPINLGGHLIMSRNVSHKNVGPKLFFHFKRAMKGALISLPYFKMYFEGYLKVLGIEASAYVNITMTQLEIYVYGKVWNLIYAELYVAAGYDYTSISDAHFYIRVIVDLRGLTDAIERARQTVDRAFKDAQKQLRQAIDKVKEAKQKCKEKLKIKCSNCYSLKCKQAEQNCKGFLDKAGKWIGGVINKAGRWIKNTVRKIGDGLAKVGRAVKSFFKGWRRRRSLIAQRDENFDIHIRNRRFISKFICEGIVGGGCKGVSHLCYGTCKAVDFIGQGLCNVLDVAVGALKLAEKACGWINSAIQFLMQMFLVHGIRFELGLGQKFNGFMVGAEIDLTLFGNRMYFGFQFDLKNPFRSIMSAKDGSLYRYQAGVRQLRTEPTFNPYDRPNPFSDFDLAGTFGIESLQTGTENRVGGCIAALTSRDRDELVLVGCNATDERQRWTYTLKGSLINLYSKKCLVMSKTVNGKVYQNNCEKETQSQLHECDVVTRTLKLRRSSLCITTAKSTPNGPGSLVHLGSLKCIHLAPSQRLVIRTGCHRVDTEFEINSHGHLIYKARNLCARPASNKAVSGAKIEMVSTSSGCHKFGFTRLGSLQHVQSRLCLQTAKREMLPNEYTELILDRKCEFSIAGRDSGSLPDAQMTFTFVPKNNKLSMQECADFYDSQLEQRFAVLNEELHSVCSKFATDVALNKIASQSSIQHNGFPSRAVDGDFNFQWEKGSCTHTKEEMNPWWRVDLGREYIVTDVTIINRGDHGERLRNIQVHVGASLVVRRNPVCHDRVRQAHDGEAVRLQCDPPIPGQFVGIQMFGKGVLSVCEVIVASRLGGLADWCQIENGGCEQICNNKCGRETSCSCLPGYNLAYDGKTCIDINECLSNNGGCRSDKQAYCVNYPGGFYCACSKGYILKDDSLKECVDINECGTRNGGCEQMCNNTLGGYMCNCRKGYERKPNDPYGCQNVNECLVKNGGCDHTCYDYDGGHFCKCKPGFRLMEDGKSCEELYCSVLESPRWGYVSPSTCTKKYQNIPVGSVCKYECAKGYEISKQTKSTTLSCRIDGTWNHASASCHPVKCHILPRPANGGLVPSRCHDTAKGYSEYGQRCVAYCKHGYRLRGPATKYCQADKQWSSGGSTVECIKVINPPYLNCPNDIEATLSTTSNWLTLGPLWQEPQTNINVSALQVYPQNVGSNYKFKFGKNLISYTAVHETGEVLACSFFVEVKDKTPPLVTNCPSDITKTSSNDREVIHWQEPTFSDNVGIREISRPYRTPGSIWVNGESARIQYIATDKAGNDQICSFTVSFKSLICPELNSTSTTKVAAYFPRRRYAVSCFHQRTLFGSYGLQGAVAYCKNGDYYIEQTNIGMVTPECVGYVKTDVNSACKEGSQKFVYDDWFSGKSYYCASCPSGTSFNQTSSNCELCRVGTYQDEQGSISCEMCPLGYSTKTGGARHITQCLERCTPGYFSASGLNETKQHCKPCPRGSFTYLNGSTVCTSCPEKATTKAEGASDTSECYQATKITRTNPNQSTAGYEKSNIEIECFFEGLPVPKVTWSKVNGNFPALRNIDYIYDLNVDIIGSSLTLYQVSTSDAGMYKCSIDNQFGRDEKMVQVGVIPKFAHGRK